MQISYIEVLCSALLLFEISFVIYLIAKYFSLKKEEKHISFIRSFKKGKCAVIFFTTVPLYFIGNVYAGNDFLYSFFYSISRICKLVVLEFDTNSIKELLKVNSFYRFTIYFNFVLVLINALCFAISVFHQRFWNWWHTLLIKNASKSKLFIFGNNTDNISIYKSDKERLKVLIDNISTKDSEDLYTKGISYISTEKNNEIIKKYLRLDKEKREYTVIINTNNDKENINICKILIDKINSLTNVSKNRIFIKKQKTELDEDQTSNDPKNRLFLRLRIFAFGDPKNQSLFEEIASQSHGCITYVNKYQQIAIDFIDRYPFSRFMDENQIDYNTSLVRDNVNINAFLIGFGKTNQEIFLTSVANNQFITKAKGGKDPVLKQVNYYIFDKNETENNKHLNHNYYRFKNECYYDVEKSVIKKEEYLPFPDLPALEKYRHLDINDTDFYNPIKNIATKNPNDENFIIIAFGSDLENIDLAHKLVEKRKEWNIPNLIIFVKVRSVIKEEDKDQKKLILNDERCFFFGNEKEVVFNIDKITKNHLNQMAIQRHEIYALERKFAEENYSINNEIIKNNKEESYNKWCSQALIKRLSNFYCCLSLRSKLNLMGLDYCKNDENNDNALSEEEYLHKYAGFDQPKFEHKIQEYNGKKIIEYSLDFPESRRRNMAIHEHLRWNSYMITKGTIPSTKEQIKTEKINGVYSNGKNDEVRRHGNLTTFDGLLEYRKIIALRENQNKQIDEQELKKNEIGADVIKYDYQLLDDAHWLLSSNGYKIIRLQSQ